MMQDRDIQAYLNAFYEGSIQADDEALLQQFFAGEVSAAWQAEQELFQALTQACETPLPSGLEQRLSQAIAAHASRQPRLVLRTWTHRLCGAAALLLLCWSLWTLHRPAPRLADTFQDPAEAALAAQQILGLVSSQLNKGLVQWNEAQSEILHAQSIIKQHLQP